MKLSPSLLRVGMKLSDPDLLQTAEPFLYIYFARAFFARRTDRRSRCLRRRPHAMLTVGEFVIYFARAFFADSVSPSRSSKKARAK
jgi:hypothetical protein